MIVLLFIACALTDNEALVVPLKVVCGVGENPLFSISSIAVSLATKKMVEKPVASQVKFTVELRLAFTDTG